LRVLLEPDVEPDRRVERRQLVEKDVGQLGLERVAVFDRGEVAALAAPVGDRARDARDHLLDRALAGGRVELAAEVLLGDDVGRVLRPGRGELDVLLLEDGADARVAQLPLDGLERVHAGLGEQTPHAERLAGAGFVSHSGLRGLLHRLLLTASRRLGSQPRLEYRGC